MANFETMIKAIALVFGGDKKETKVQDKGQLQRALAKMKK